MIFILKKIFTSKCKNMLKLFLDSVAGRYSTVFIKYLISNTQILLNAIISKVVEI